MGPAAGIRINKVSQAKAGNRLPSACREISQEDPANGRTDNNRRLDSVSRTDRRFSRSRLRASIPRGNSVAPEVSNDRVV